MSHIPTFSKDDLEFITSLLRDIKKIQKEIREKIVPRNKQIDARLLKYCATCSHFSKDEDGEPEWDSACCRGEAQCPLSEYWTIQLNLSADLE